VSTHTHAHNVAHSPLKQTNSTRKKENAATYVHCETLAKVQSVQATKITFEQIIVMEVETIFIAHTLYYAKKTFPSQQRCDYT
jgi:hypothetical protein